MLDLRLEVVNELGTLNLEHGTWNMEAALKPSASLIY
jgi:hypothetical protein